MPKKRAAITTDNKSDIILEAALQEFARHPYHAASLNNVIRTSGLSKGVVYYYFSSKEDLFLTLLQESIRELGAALSSLAPVSAQGREDYWHQVSTNRFAMSSA